MTQFLKIGDRYINPDRVTDVTYCPALAGAPHRESLEIMLTTFQVYPFHNPPYPEPRRVVITDPAEIGRVLAWLGENGC